MFGRALALYQNAYSGLSRKTWLLSIVLLINRSGTMVVPFMTIYLTRPAMGYSLGQAGVVVGVFGLGSVCGGLIGGRLTDKIGFHRIQLITLAGGGLLFMVLGQLKSYPLICCCAFVLNLVNDAFRPANSTAIAAYSKDENRTRSFSLNRLAMNLGWAVGGTIGGILASVNIHLLFWVDGGTNLLAALLLKLLMGHASATGAAQKESASNEPVLSPYKDKIYLVFIVCTTVYAACFFQIFSVLPIFYKRVFHMPEYMIGLLMAMNGLLIACFEMVLVFQMEGRRHSLSYIFYGTCLVGFTYCLLNILPGYAYTAYFCMFLMTAGEILSSSFLNSFWISRTQVANRGRYAGLYTIAWSTAQVVGPSGGAEIAQHAGFNALWWIVGGTCLLAGLGFRRLRQIISASHE